MAEKQMIKQKVIEQFIQGQRGKQNIARNWERGKTVHSRAFPVVGDDDGIKGPDLFPTRVHRPTVALLSQTTGRRHPAVGHGWGVQLTGHVVRDRPHATAVAADVILGGGGSRASDNTCVVPSLRDAGVGPGLKLCFEGRGGGRGGGGGGGRSRRRWVFGPCDELNSVVDRGRERIVVRVCTTGRCSASNPVLPGRRSGQEEVRMLVLSASVISSAEEAGGEVVIKLSGENCQELFKKLQEQY